MPSQSETIIRGLLASADIEVNGSNPLTGITGGF
jgi:hypothetical protein